MRDVGFFVYWDSLFPNAAMFKPHVSFYYLSFKIMMLVKLSWLILNRDLISLIIYLIHGYKLSTLLEKRGTMWPKSVFNGEK